MVRVVIATVLAFTVAAGSRADEISDVRDRERLLAQKWSRDIGVALEVSRGLERTDPAAARETLNSALTQLRTVAGLSETTRQDLTRRLESQLRTVAAPAPRPRTAVPTVVAQAQDVPRPRTAPPNSQAEAAKSFFEERKAAVGQAKAQKADAQKAFNGTITSAEKSVVPAGDQAMVLAPNHKEIMAKREAPLNKKEAAVMTSLNTTMTADFTGMNFRQFIDSMAQKSGLLLQADPQSLKDANVDYDDPVNFKSASKISVRSILRKVLADRGLSYVVNENGLDIVTVEKARNTTVVRVYSINDLVQPIQPQPQGVYDPFTGRFVQAPPGAVTQKQIVGQQIVDLIKASVDPGYWAANGPGSIAFNEATGTIIVRASAEVQFMVSGALRR